MTTAPVDKDKCSHLVSMLIHQEDGSILCPFCLSEWVPAKGILRPVVGHPMEYPIDTLRLKGTH